MAGYWLKLYTEILDDYKYHQLPDKSKLLMYELFLLAKKIDKNGILPEIDEIAFLLRRPKEEIMDAWEPLSRLGIVSEDEDSAYVTHFQDRQAPIDSTERSKYYRDKKNKEAFEPEKRDYNEDATNRDREKRREEKNITDIPAIAEVEEKVRTPEEIKAMTIKAISDGQNKHADSVYDKALKRQYTSVEVSWCQEFTKCTGLHPEPSQVLDWCKCAKINIGAGITVDKIHDVLEYMQANKKDYYRPGSILLFGQKYLAEKTQPAVHVPAIGKYRE
jgi:hypothetical protein